MAEMHDHTSELFSVSPEVFLELQDAFRDSDPTPVSVHTSILTDLGKTPEVDELNEHLASLLNRHNQSAAQFGERVERAATDGVLDMKAEEKSDKAWMSALYGFSPEDIDQVTARLLFHYPESQGGFSNSQKAAYLLRLMHMF